MSDLLYLAIQAVVLICYASYIAYRVGYQKGRDAIATRIVGESRQVADHFLKLKKKGR
jgi:hypothetical protein